MSSAGRQLVAGRIPGERIATVEATSDSANFTAEAVVMSVAAPLVAGRVYRVRFIGQFQSTDSGDRIYVRLREDSVSGSQMAVVFLVIPFSSGSPGWPVTVEREFTATATGSKTFVVCGQRASGSGDCRLEAGGSWPSYLYVDYIRG